MLRFHDRKPTAAPAPSRGLWARSFTVVLLLLQLFASVGAPVLDGAVRHADDVVVHIEDASEKHCPVEHHAADCQLCHAINVLRAIPSAKPAALVAHEERSTVQHRDPLVAARATERDANASRAPPLA